MINVEKDNNILKDCYPKDIDKAFTISNDMDIILSNLKETIKEYLSQSSILPLKILSKINSAIIYVGYDSNSFKKLLFNCKNERRKFINNDISKYCDTIIDQSKSFEIYYKLLSNYVFYKLEILPKIYVQSLTYFKKLNYKLAIELSFIGNIGKKLELLIESNIESDNINTIKRLEINNIIFFKFYNTKNILNFIYSFNYNSIEQNLSKYNKIGIQNAIRLTYFKDIFYKEFNIEYINFEIYLKLNNRIIY